MDEKVKRMVLFARPLFRLKKFKNHLKIGGLIRFFIIWWENRLKTNFVFEYKWKGL